MKTTMKKVILLSLLGIFFATAAGYAQQPAAAPASKAKILTRSELDNLLATPGKVLLLDVRSPIEIATNGGFPVYLNIQAADLEKHLSDIPKDRPIVTVSNHANRAGMAAELLSGKGFNIVGAIGAQVYESDGGKVVKYALPKPAAATEK